MSGEPIFIVGVPRSGTTLLASILSEHSRLACGPETAFFASMAGPLEILPQTAANSWPTDALRFLEETRLEGETHLERYAVSRDQMTGFLAGIDPSPVGVLEGLGIAVLEATGKSRWMEKSPVHLLYVREIRRHFPNAPIVRIERDPRDVAMSLTRVPWGPGSFVGGLLYWRRFHERSRGFFQADAASFTVRYERLVTEPEAELGRLCEFLGESLEPRMLADSREADVLVRPTESWKENVGGAIDSSRSERWRSLGAVEQRAAYGVLGDLLKELDYPLSEMRETRRSKQWTWLAPMHEGAAEDREVRRRLEEGERIWPSAGGEKAARGVLVGEPDADDWLGRTSSERLRSALGIVMRTAGLRLRGKPVSWRRRPTGSEGSGNRGTGNSGWSARAIGLALRLLRVDREEVVG